jgi:polyisoprenoid-binding protein YceI
MEPEKWCVVRAASAAILLVLSLGGCPTRPRPPEAPASTAIEAPPPAPGQMHHEGRPYDVQSRESLLTILAFRGGALAKAGHNHVIACHDLAGTFYVPEDINRSTFELHMPVAQLVVDEPELRAREGADFPTDVPESAKEGTRRNMLSQALLNGADFPDISLVSNGIQANGASVQASVQVTVRGQQHAVRVPVTYTLANGELIATGDFPLKQSDLGLTPFSAMLGALQVQDEMRVRFRVVAREAQTRH